MSQTSDSFCLPETKGRTSERASEADRTRHFHSICGGSDVRCEADRTSDGMKKHLYSDIPYKAESTTHNLCPNDERLLPVQRNNELVGYFLARLFWSLTTFFKGKPT